MDEDSEPGRGDEREELDDVTLERARRGERAACVALVLRYQGPVFALLSRFLGARDPSLVDDLAQETFFRVFRELPRFRRSGPARLSTWILTIATRLAIDEHRRRGRRGDMVELPPEAAGPDRTDELAERRRLGEALARAVAQLPEDQRAVFLLRAYHDLDYAEIAEALGCDLGTVKSRLSRARARLREALERDGVEMSDD
jgi:RNA polymerase sigma-70 factor (ECF subfamily)